MEEKESKFDRAGDFCEKLCKKHPIVFWGLFWLIFCVVVGGGLFGVAVSCVWLEENAKHNPNYIYVAPTNCAHGIEWEWCDEHNNCGNEVCIKNQRQWPDHYTPHAKPRCRMNWGVPSPPSKEQKQRDGDQWNKWLNEN